MAVKWGYFKVWLARAAKPRFRWRGRFIWLSIPKIPSGPDSHRKTESSDH
jgi:hypothetical protein